MAQGEPTQTASSGGAQVRGHTSMTHPIAPVTGGHSDELRLALHQLDAAPGRLDRLVKAWTGTSPAAFLSKESRASLDDRLARLGVNFPRLAVDALVERLDLAGIGAPDAPTWGRFLRANGRELAGIVHTDRLLFGSSYVTVWATETGRATLTPDSPLTMTHRSDPATGETLWAARRWDTGTELRPETTVELYLADRVERYTTSSSTLGNPYAWTRRRVIDNPLGVVPVVPFVRRVSLTDPPTGASAVEDILDLTDALAKLLGDAMVTSEYAARPRRWATGLEIEEDEDGNIVDPFGSGRFLQSEAPDTEFGQLPASRLDGYADLMAALTQQIGALTGLPAHYLGLHGDQPASADGIRSAEAQLVARARAEQRAMTNEWATVGGMLDAVEDARPFVPSTVDPSLVSWANPETSTPAMDADAAVKLAGIGLPLDVLLVDRMGYDPDEARRIADRAHGRAVELAAARTRSTRPEPVVVPTESDPVT